MSLPVNLGFAVQDAGSGCGGSGQTALMPEPALAQVLFCSCSLPGTAAGPGLASGGLWGGRWGVPFQGGFLQGGR